MRNEFILEDVEVDDDDEEESEDDGWGEIERNEKHEVGRTGGQTRDVSNLIDEILR